MNKHHIINLLQYFQKNNIDFKITLHNNETYEYEPYIVFKEFCEKTKLPHIISIYDAGWDDIDIFYLNDIKECTPNTYSKL